MGSRLKRLLFGGFSLRHKWRSYFFYFTPSSPAVLRDVGCQENLMVKLIYE